MATGMMTTVTKVATTAAGGVPGSPAGTQNIQMKESFADVIYNLSPTDTPFQSMAKRESINSIEFGWFADQLASAAVQVGIPEGADVPSGSFEEVKRVMNLTQIFMKSVMVSNTAESVDFYGRKSEMAYQMTKKSQELKRDIEATLCGKARGAKGGFFNTFLVGSGPGITPVPPAANPAVPPTNNTDGVREMSNYKYQVINNPLKTVTVPTPPAVMTAPNRTVVDLGGAAIKEADLNTLMEAQWKYGGSAKTALVTAGAAKAIASFAMNFSNSVGGSARFRDIGNEKKLVNVVDIYVTPFGEMKIGLSRWLNMDEDAAHLHDIFLIDPKYISIPYLRQPATTNVPVVGDREQKLITAELSFKLSAPDGCGLLTNFILPVGITPLEGDEPEGDTMSAPQSARATTPTVPRRISQ